MCDENIDKTRGISQFRLIRLLFGISNLRIIPKLRFRQDNYWLAGFPSRDGVDLCVASDTPPMFIGHCSCSIWLGSWRIVPPLKNSNQRGTHMLDRLRVIDRSSLSPILLILGCQHPLGTKHIRNWIGFSVCRQSIRKKTNRKKLVLVLEWDRGWGLAADKGRSATEPFGFQTLRSKINPASGAWLGRTSHS